MFPNFPRFQVPRREAPKELIPFEFRVCPRGPHKPQRWQFCDGRVLAKIFPSAPASIKHFQSQDYLSLFPVKKNQKIIDRKRLKYANMRRSLPHFNSQFRQGISGLTLRQIPTQSQHWNTSEERVDPSVQCLNKIFREAKNLRSLVLETECKTSNVRAIRRLHSLEELTLKITINQIIAFPQLFKDLLRVQRVKLQIISPAKQWGSHMIPIMNKFFGFLLSLPRLEHINIRLENCEDYYKTLLEEIHRKKLSSFHIIVYNTGEISEKSTLIPWRNYIDTLYLGPINTVSSKHQVQHFNNSLKNEKSQKRLSLNSPRCFKTDLLELVEGSETLKSLYVIDSKGIDLKQARSLLAFISRTKTLESLTLHLEATFKESGEVLYDFIKQVFELKSIENLQSLAVDLKNPFHSYAHLPIPYNPKMKNLKSLKINIHDCPLTTDLSYLTEGLKDLINLENLKLDYVFGNLHAKNINKDRIICNIPFVGFKNLQSFSLRCNGVFSDLSAQELLNGIVQIPNLKSLFISSRILDHLRESQGVELTEGLRSKESLETAEFAWKESGEVLGRRVSMKRVDREMKVSSISYLSLN